MCMESCRQAEAMWDGSASVGTGHDVCGQA